MIKKKLIYGEHPKSRVKKGGSRMSTFVTIQVLEGSYIIPPRKLKSMFMDLYEECKHGDEEHMNWLKNKIETFVDKLNN